MPSQFRRLLFAFSWLALFSPYTVAGNLFLPAVHYTVGPPSVFSLATGTLDGDTFPDIVAVGGGGATNDLSILINNGDGSFHNGSTLSIGFAGLTSVAVGDFNRDGKQDIVAASAGDKAIYVLLGNGDGTFQAPLVHSTFTDALTIGDFNQDGKLDIANVGRDGLMRVLFGKGDGTFPTSHSYRVSSSRNYSIVAANLNQDLYPDIVVASSAGTHHVPALTVFLNNDDGTFQPGVTYDGGTSPLGVAVGFVDGDPWPDLVVASVGLTDPGDVRWLKGNGDGTFQPPVVITTTAVNKPTAVALADFLHNGNLDIVASNQRLARITFLPGNGDGTFGSPQTLPASKSRILIASDLNGDGFVDIVGGGASGGGVDVILNAK
jgi:hypothetical protein